MFDFELSTHPHLDDALRAFAARHNITKLAKLAGLNPQTVSNKLNPDQPHELTVREMLMLIAVSEDMSLMDAALRQVNCLPAVAINELAREKLDHYALGATAQIGLLAAHASQHERMTPRRRREIVETVNTGIRYLSLAALAVQVRIQSNPAIASTMDMAGAIGSSVGMG